MAGHVVQLDVADDASEDWAAAIGQRPAPAECLLEADPGLAGCLAPAERADLRSRLRVRVEALDEGPWTPAPAPPGRPSLGLLVLDGLLLRELTVSSRCCTELLGPGDVLRPWSDDPAASVPADAAFRVLRSPTRVAVLGHRASVLIGRFPALVAELLDRSLARSRALQFQLALTQVSGVDQRVLLLLWHLADRFGRVTPRGVVVRLDLTHETLGRMIGARRPSVTTAVRRLIARGDVAARRREWVLLGDPEAHLRRSREMAGGRVTAMMRPAPEPPPPAPAARTGARGGPRRAR